MSNSTATVSEGKVISIRYSLANSAGKILDTSGDDGPPLLYLHGASNIVPGLERALKGKSVGDSVKVEVSPEDGYGERQEIEAQKVERDAFPDDLPLEVDMQFAIMGPDDEPIPVWVIEVTDTHVTIDFNHPLAGETLHFDVTITEIRDATEDEVSHGHPHGPGGHHH